MLSPVFVKGTIRFVLEKRRFEVLPQNISPYGVTGLPWGELSATEHFGHKVEVEVELAVGDGLSFKCRGHVTREYTATSEAMGVKFELDPALTEKVGEYVRKYGYSPSEFLRKYPRIPSSSMIQPFP